MLGGLLQRLGGEAQLGLAAWTDAGSGSSGQFSLVGALWRPPFSLDHVLLKTFFGCLSHVNLFSIRITDFVKSKYLKRKKKICSVDTKMYFEASVIKTA